MVWFIGLVQDNSYGLFPRSIVGLEFDHSIVDWEEIVSELMTSLKDNVGYAIWAWHLVWAEFIDCLIELFWGDLCPGFSWHWVWVVWGDR